MGWLYDVQNCRRRCTRTPCKVVPNTSSAPPVCARARRLRLPEVDVHQVLPVSFGEEDPVRAREGDGVQEDGVAEHAHGVHVLLALHTRKDLARNTLTAINANRESHNSCVLLPFDTQYFVVFYHVLKVQNAK